MNTRVYARVLLGLLCLCTLISAQNNAFLAGEVIATGGADVARLTVEVTSLTTMSQAPERTFVGSNGRFEVRNLEPGNYQLRVMDESGAVIGSTTQNTGSMFGPVEIRIAGASKAPVGKGKVSLSSLRADPDGKAERELNNALWYARDKNLDKARKHFGKALKADAAHTRTFANWAAFELQHGQLTEAEALARRGLAFEPGDVKLLHALGVSLLAQGVLTDETATALEAAGAVHPQLYLAAAEVAYKRGQAAKANHLAEAYIRSGEKELATAAHQIMGRTKGFLETAR